MKDYSKMSDFEIANKVLEALGFKHNKSGYGFDIYLSKHSRKDTGTKASKGFRFDPCNNPSDAWPIMKESLIGVTPDEDGVTMHFYGDWTARAHCKNLQFTDKNPLRAAMIVYLMMKDEEK